MCYKWRFLFLIFPEVTFSDSPNIQRLILCIIIKLVSISTHSFPILSNIEWNMHKLTSLDSANEKFYPLSLTTFINLDSLITSSPEGCLQTTTTGQKLWNVLIQSMYSPTWNPAEILSPISRKDTQIFSRKQIFIIGSFPSLPEEYNVFFSRNVQCFRLQQLSTLFFDQVLTPDLTKSLFSNSIHLVWINTNANMSKLTLSLQKVIKEIFFINKSEIHSVHNLHSLFAFSQLDTLPFTFSMGTFYSTYILWGIFGILSLQSRVYLQDLFLPKLNNIVSNKFIRLLNHSTSPGNVLSLDSIKIISCLKSYKISFLTFFDFDYVFFLSYHHPCNFSNSNQHYLAIITEKNGATAIVLLNFLSEFIGCYTSIHIFKFLSLALFRFKLYDRLNLHISNSISFPCVNLPPFSSHMLFHSFIFSLRRYTPDVPLPRNHDLLELIDNDYVRNQHSSFTDLYVFSRPCSSKFHVHFNNLRTISGIGVSHTVKGELVDSELESIFNDVNNLSILIHSVLYTPEFTSKANVFVSNLSKTVSFIIVYCHSLNVLFMYTVLLRISARVLIYLDHPLTRRLFMYIYMYVCMYV